jgi:hypothetical protein
MPKIRAIHPGFWTDTTLAECSMGARLFYVGLWTFADDAGVFEWHDKLLKSQIFPFDDSVKVDKLLSELLQQNRILSFLHNGKKYGLIVNFDKYQKPDSRYVKYTIGTLDEVKEICHAVDTACARGAPSTEGEGVSEGEGEGESAVVARSAPTPAQQAIEFFGNEDQQREAVGKMVAGGWTDDDAWREVRAFVRYWTEPTLSGKKQRWQTQKAFEVRRRLTTWTAKALSYSPRSNA